jgi:hypothetical protein
MSGLFFMIFSPIVVTTRSGRRQIAGFLRGLVGAMAV